MTASLPWLQQSARTSHGVERVNGHSSLTLLFPHVIARPVQPRFCPGTAKSSRAGFLFIAEPEMAPLGPRSLARLCSMQRPCTQQPVAGGYSHRQGVRRALLGTATGFAAAAGFSTVAQLSSLPPLAAAAGVVPRGEGPQPGEFGHPRRRATDVFLATNVLLFGLQWLTKDLVTVWGIKINALVLQGQWWRLITPAFLHGSLVHLVVNSYSLNNIGPAVEQTAGPVRFAFVYLASALAGTVASFYGSAAPSLGASGAVFGVGGALAMHFYRNRDVYGKRSDHVLRQLWQTLLVNLLYGLSNPRIDNWGHMGGLAGGALAALVLGPRYRAASLPGKRGTWLVDDAPLPWFRDAPRQISSR